MFVSEGVKLSASQSASQSVRPSVRPSVRVRLLGETATSRQSRADRSVGEVRDFRAVKRLSNGASDMMTEAEGAARGAEMSERVVVMERDGRLRLSCDTAATVPTRSQLAAVRLLLQSAVCRQASSERAEG